MKKIVTRIFVVLAVLGLAAGVVSCNKNNKKDTGVGFWKVESDNAEEEGYSSLYHAWYFYSEDRDAYEICFSDKDVYANRHNSNWAYVDLAEFFCGVEHSLTEDLNVEGKWNFYGGTRSLKFFNKKFSDGTIYLKVDLEKNSVVFRLNGTTEAGAKIKIDYVGSAKRMDEMVCPE